MAIATLCVLCEHAYVGVIPNGLIYIILLHTEVVQWIDKNPGDYMDIWQLPRTALLEKKFIYLNCCKEEWKRGIQVQYS